VGNALQLSAEVIGEYNPPQTVIWEVRSMFLPETGRIHHLSDYEVAILPLPALAINITVAGLLAVGTLHSIDPLTRIYVYAVSTFNPDEDGRSVIVIQDGSIFDPTQTPTAVNITGGAQVAQGSTLQLEGSVVPASAAQDVTWTLVNAVDGVSISGNGQLTVGSNVAVGTVITVRAASAGIPEIYATHDVTVVTGETDFILGDILGTGAGPTALDLIWMRMILQGATDQLPSPYDFRAADIDGDGVIGPLDFMWLRMILEGVDLPF
jgi:hypothetical protein